MDTKKLSTLIKLFLEINPSPSDQQFHDLAFSLGTDPETLEAVSYRMLAERENVTPVESTATLWRTVNAGVAGPNEDHLSEQEQVLDGDYDPNVTSPNDLLLNDGAPEGTSNIEQSQDALYNDGVGADDTGVDIFGDKEAMISDGEPPVNLKAASRLMASGE